MSVKSGLEKLYYMDS